MKKTSSFILVTLVLALIFCPSVFALDTNTDKATNIVERGNYLIDMRIDQSVATADTISGTQANSQVTDNIVNNLCRQTHTITLNTIDQASNYGLVVDSYYTPVYIGGETVLVDPMRVSGN